MGQDTLQVPGSGRFETVGSVYSTDVEYVLYCLYLNHAKKIVSLLFLLSARTGNLPG